jgi:hypothetical protein
MMPSKIWTIEWWNTISNQEGPNIESFMFDTRMIPMVRLQMFHIRLIQNFVLEGRINTRLDCQGRPNTAVIELVRTTPPNGA